ncbi:hypothetical protein EDB80DRAFT_752074 [Ilyonectria destructans]|nr:hypothetical protein EDB80DRAFT_752074 [Ilyonectria destructans]
MVLSKLKMPLADKAKPPRKCHAAAPERVLQSTLLNPLKRTTALAFLAKAHLSTASVLAFRQRAWMTSAELSLCLAIYIWATPLLVILTSDTLYVVPRTLEEHSECSSVRTLNFGNEETIEWQALKSIEGRLYQGLVFWVASQRVALARENPAKQIYNDSWNCSFVVDFIGPGYKCDELAVGRGSRVKKLGREKAPFTTKDTIPDGEFSYLAVIDETDYAPQQVESGPGGKPTKRLPYAKNLGTWRTEPIIWIGCAAVNDMEQPQPLNRAIDDDGTLDNTTVPKTNYIFPRDTHRYRRAAAHHSRVPLLESTERDTNVFRSNDLISAIKPQFAVVAWAQHPSQPSGIRVGGAKTNYPCIRTFLCVFYEYRLIQLCLVYGVSILLAVVGACSGLVAAREEGVMRNMKTSSIIIAFGWVLESYGWIPAFGLEADVTRERPHLGSRSTSPQYVGERATF